MYSHTTIRSSFGTRVLVAAALAALSVSAPTFGQSADVGKPSSWFASRPNVDAPSAPTFDEALNAAASNTVDEVRLTPVRESALRETAMTVGMQWGIGDMSRAVISEYEIRAARLDKWYQFNSMMMGVGFLPPVISEAKNLISVQDRVMRVANVAWHLDEEARPVVVPPTWRDWLYVGLQPDLRPPPPSTKAVLPRDAAEKAFYRQEMLKGYAEGKDSVGRIVSLNRAKLDRTYDGMRKFFDLWKAGKVSAPTLASATSIIDREDKNTVVVGSTVFRITAPTEFVTDTGKWKPLAE